MGTAVLIAGHLAITAGHVLDQVLKQFGVACELVLFQVLPGPAYRLWNVSQAWLCSTDIALLHMAPTPRVTSSVDLGLEWKVPRLKVSAPLRGEKVIAFGFREGKIAVTEDENGVHHIELNDVGTIAIGEVGEIFPVQRDASMLTFPCFEVRARFAPGMSGGLVMDGSGDVCGLVCAGVTFISADTPPLSYATTLWPMLTTMISADRGDKYPRGSHTP
jgi:Trypsin-like peptidase domain